MNRTMTTALAALAVLGTGAAARAQSTANGVGVRDGARMFSAEALKGADGTLAEVRRKTHWSVLVETVESLDGKTVKDAAMENVKALNEHGLYLLISKHDHQFYAEPSHSAQSTFSHETIKSLKDTITGAFKAKKFDEGLLDSVALIRRAAEARPDTAATATALAPAGFDHERHTDSEPAAAGAPPAAVAQTGSVLPTLLFGGGAVLVVLWLLSRVFRRTSLPQPPYAQSGPGAGPGYGTPGQPRPTQGYGPPQPGYGPQPVPGYGGYGGPPQQGGGGGFLSGVLGGAAGAMAGNVLYDKFGRPHEGQGQPAHVPGNVDPQQASTWPQGHTDPAAAPSELYDPNAGGGGDWGSAATPPEPNADAGGDWGTPDPAAPGNDPGGGDWGSPAPDDNSGGGDWGSDNSTPDDQGGSW